MADGLEGRFLSLESLEEVSLENKSNSTWNRNSQADCTSSGGAAASASSVSINVTATAKAALVPTKAVPFSCFQVLCD